jgi:glucosamine--fructose-6-phosphate aminotransferase (isomerizing)
MCGIIGYVGPRATSEVLLSCLSRLEYRGYDSAGVAVVGDEGLRVVRAEGKLRNLEQRVADLGLNGSYGLGHTRWATHGRPSEENAHPHRDCRGRLVVVHNGIVENYRELKARLVAQGHRFLSETDSEVIAHLLETHFAGRLEDAVRAALGELEGVFAFAALSLDDPGTLVATRQGPPLVIGVGDGESFVASDVPAFLHYTRNALYLDDGEVAVVGSDGIRLLGRDGSQRRREPTVITWDPIQVEKQGFRHFMLKEIHEQPRAARDTLLGRYSLEQGRVEPAELGLDPSFIRSLRRVTIAACGTSWHAGLVAKFLIEGLARLPVDVDVASELRYRNPILGPEDLVIGISQSGETADTLAALRAAGELGATTLAVCNVVGSLASRVCDHTLYTHAGPEIGVASTKAFTAQLVALQLIALYLAQERGRLGPDEVRTRLVELARVGHLMEQVLDGAAAVEEVSRELVASRDVLYLGRGMLYPIALEGALKLKEISYIHAEGYPAGEMKHGPIALIDDAMPVVALAPALACFEKMASNIQEAKARGARVIAVVTSGDERLRPILNGPHDRLLTIPPVSEAIAPLVAVLPLQLLAYQVAVARGCDVDQPRNLAKSVTVE